MIYFIYFFKFITFYLYWKITTWLIEMLHFIKIYLKLNFIYNLKKIFIFILPTLYKNEIDHKKNFTAKYKFVWVDN